MAVLADVGGLHMRWAFARCVGAVVTTGTIVDDVGVVKRGGRPCNRRMAVVAVISTADMRRMFAGCRHSVMTRATRTDYLRVVNGKHGYPDVRCMTVFADIARLNMCLILARGICAVMAAGTIARDVDVIEIRGQPAGRRMAVVTVVATVNVILVLAARDDAIVAGSTGPNHLCVINRINGSPDV